MAINIKDKINLLIRGFAENFSYKKFLFVLHLETAGFFINSYNLILAFVTLICSFFVADFITKDYISTGLYVASIFLYIFMIILSIVSLKGMENGSKIKFMMGMIPTLIWPILFFSAILTQIMKLKFSLVFAPKEGFIEFDGALAIIKYRLIPESNIVGILFIFMFLHIYFAIYFVGLYINKCRN